MTALLTSPTLYFLCHLLEHPSGQTQSSGHIPHGRLWSALPPVPLVMDILQSVWPSRGDRTAIVHLSGGFQDPYLRKATDYFGEATVHI